MPADFLRLSRLLSLSAENRAITNIGNANTDFDTNGGLTLADDLVMPDNVPIGFGTASADGTLMSDGTDLMWIVPATADVMLGRTGAPSPDSILHIWIGDAGAITAPANTLLTLEQASNGAADTILEFLGNAGRFQGITWGNITDGNARAYIRYGGSTASPADTLNIQVAGAELAFLDSVGIKPLTGKKIQAQSGIIGISVVSTAYTLGSAGTVVVPNANMSGAADDTARDVLAGNINGAIAIDTGVTGRIYIRDAGAWKFVLAS